MTYYNQVSEEEKILTQRLILRQVSLKCSVELLKEKNKNDIITKDMILTVTEWMDEILLKPFGNKLRLHDEKIKGKNLLEQTKINGVE